MNIGNIILALIALTGPAMGYAATQVETRYDWLAWTGVAVTVGAVSWLGLR